MHAAQSCLDCFNTVRQYNFLFRFLIGNIIMFSLRGTCSHLVSKFCIHLTKIDFVHYYLISLVYVELLHGPLVVNIIRVHTSVSWCHFKSITSWIEIQIQFKIKIKRRIKWGQNFIVKRISLIHNVKQP